MHFRFNFSFKIQLFGKKPSDIQKNNFVKSVIDFLKLHFYQMLKHCVLSTAFWDLHLLLQMTEIDRRCAGSPSCKVEVVCCFL